MDNDDLTVFAVTFRVLEKGTPFPYGMSYRAPMNTVRQIAKDFTSGVKVGLYTVTNLQTPDTRVLALRFSDVLCIG